MTRHLILLLSFCSLLATPVRAQERKTCCRLAKDYRTLGGLGREYRRLRRQAGSQCCDRFNSGLMQALTALRDSLQPGTSAKRIIALMGRPDLRSATPYGGIEPPPGDVLLIYHWRGPHDFLYFVVSHGRMVKCEWYNAWE